jgi:adenine specific DNA methylase Mod
MATPGGVESDAAGIRGRVKRIYIDPPYNTGNEGWVYNENLSKNQRGKYCESITTTKGYGNRNLC